jgi:catechol 2,3-dioxygenase-like lactoylglutathione lyase family enzyme
MAPIARFSLVALDCPDPLALARFYGAITGWDVEDDDGDWDGTEDWVELRSPAGATIAFQRAADHQPPRWPSADHPQQLHLDFDVPDLDDGERAVLGLGATKADVQPGTSFRVYLDPAGHPFCLVLDPDTELA